MRSLARETAFKVIYKALFTGDFSFEEIMEEDEIVLVKELGERFTSKTINKSKIILKDSFTAILDSSSLVSPRCSVCAPAMQAPTPGIPSLWVSPRGQA